MRKKQAIAWMLSLAMALAPLSVCSRQSISGADDEEMTRELKVTGEVIEVATNEQGVYNVPSLVEGKEPTYETCEAEVTGFTNDNGTVHLSFQAEAPGAILSWTYTIRFAGSDCYVVVQTGPVVSDVTIQEVDYDVQIAELANYKPDFKEEDIVLPEGTYIEDGQVFVTKDASETVRETLVESGYAEEEMSRLGDENADDDPLPNPSGDNSNADDADSAAKKYMQETNAIKKKYDNWTAVADYAPGIASEIDPQFGKAVELGSDVFRIFKAYTTNDWGSGIQGTMGVLKMFGLFKGGGGGVSNEQILSEVQKVGIEVSDMHELTKFMSVELGDTLKQAYANNLQPFDNAVAALHMNAELVQNMLTEGAIRAAQDGIEPPDEDCDAEAEFDYNYELIEFIKKLQSTGGRKNSAFKDFSNHVENLTSAYTAVTTELAKREEFNPVKSYDKYWNLHFNYESQGYYLRKAYRGELEYELKRAYALMVIYYNIFDPYTKGNYLEYNN